MTELQKILKAYSKIDSENNSTALATIVKVQGSSYRRPGARMIISSDGFWAGMISGGCLEGDALLHAQKIIQQGNARVIRYDLTGDHSNIFGLGLGCNGIIDVLIEPISQSNIAPIQALRECEMSKLKAVIATVFRAEGVAILKIGDRFILKQNDSTPTDFASPIVTEIEQEMKSALDNGKSCTKTLTISDGEIEVFFEIVSPPRRLVVFGSGFDSIPVVALAEKLGWNVFVAEDSPGKAYPYKFPKNNAFAYNLSNVPVCQLVAEAEINSTLIDENTAVLIMSHNFGYDVSALRQVLLTSVRYIGILGSQLRSEMIFAELKNTGSSIADSDFERIFSPVGLDIGAETPEEIAVAIMGEIYAVFTNRNAEFLRDKVGAIHNCE